MAKVSSNNKVKLNKKKKNRKPKSKKRGGQFKHSLMGHPTRAKQNTYKPKVVQETSSESQS